MAPRSPSRATGTSAGRVIAGSARGVRLIGPGEGTRPLGDRVKQTLFAILEPTIRGRLFLDLYAGSGSAGIEALSRGASGAVFVEFDRKAVRAIRRNLEAAGLAGPSVVVADQRVSGWLAKAGVGAGPFAAVVVDPPYDAPKELDRALAGIADAGLGVVLAADGIVVAKHFWKEPPGANRLLRSFRQERFGETALSFYRWADDARTRDAPARGCLMRTALYPGSFDPVTNGHLDVLVRALAVFDQVVMAVLENPRKTPLFPTETRVVVLEKAIRDAGIDPDHASVTTFAGLTVEAARTHEARWIVRGLRAISDFESEGQLAANNRVLADDIDTVFFMTAIQYGYVSSSLVKEIALFGGDVSSMVPPAAVTALRAISRSPERPR